MLGEGDDAFEFPLGRTVWYSVVGTGDPITIDPRGSDFDTVIAAYTSSANDLVQAGCVDDDEIGQTQGLLTFDTTLGTTYLVQIGGVIGQFDGDPKTRNGVACGSASRSATPTVPRSGVAGQP